MIGIQIVIDKLARNDRGSIVSFLEIDPSLWEKLHEIRCGDILEEYLNRVISNTEALRSIRLKVSPNTPLGKAIGVIVHNSKSKQATFKRMTVSCSLYHYNVLHDFKDKGCGKMSNLIGASLDYVMNMHEKDLGQLEVFVNKWLRDSYYVGESTKVKNPIKSPVQTVRSKRKHARSSMDAELKADDEFVGASPEEIQRFIKEQKMKNAKKKSKAQIQNG